MTERQSTLEQLRNTGTTIVCDSGEVKSISQYKPYSCTTNPAIILAAAKDEMNKEYVTRAVEYGKTNGTTEKERIELAFDNFFVEMGCQILEVVPGRVSTEVDARLSFDTAETVRRALQIVKMYEEKGVSKERLLIKIASTWEGIQAAKILESEYEINCNLTLLFSFIQAVACAEAGVTLISPFVGRVMDFFKEKTGETYTEDNDPGVLMIKSIFEYYKEHGYNTIVMGTCFRNNMELLALAGIDSVTLPLDLLETLSTSYNPVSQKLFPPSNMTPKLPKVNFYICNESRFRYDLNQDAMVTEKLADGIRRFAKDNENLELLFSAKILSDN
ncbi:sedoheptulose-7-phosphate:D-glyceraldehyde-3- phosphate transaldolase [Maudiozyma exigua]|uniref:Transaldolase n=1 Tax=Maudiozyma exigua TaxID=34358 RepID=A0A9P6W2R5_MAUEX|nr:sedoheptulose-7-phosphate:D-glyceraldehyde-3- phosphate transaldolase [Kazachstania exigua]